MSSACGQAARDLLATLQYPPLDEAEVDVRVRALGTAQRGATPAQSRAAMEVLAAGLDLPEAASAEVAARVLGAMIEQGHDPAPARIAMVSMLRRILSGCVELAQAARAVAGEQPDAIDAKARARWIAMQYEPALQGVAEEMTEAAQDWSRLAVVWPGAIALLSADPIARAEAADLLEPVQQLQDVHEAAGWLRAMLNVLHDAPFVAIEPHTGIGISGRMSGVVENQQLHTLLMDAVPWTKQRRLSRAALAVARGVGPQQARDTIAATWDLFDHSGEPIPDDGMPAAIPVLDGHCVIALRPAGEERSWRAQRMFAILPARIERERLDEAAVACWLAKIEAPASH